LFHFQYGRGAETPVLELSRELHNEDIRLVLIPRILGATQG